MPTLEERRRAIRISVRELADIAGLDQNTVARVLKDDGGLMRTQRAIIHALEAEEKRLYDYLRLIIAESMLNRQPSNRS